MTDSAYQMIRSGVNYCFCLSGGRSSAYMLRQVIDAHGGDLPDNVKVVFNNTGKEREETLEFVQEIADRWKVDIAWLEYVIDRKATGGKKDPIHRHRRVDFKTASRKGEPFAAMISYKYYLPHRVARICTAELKVQTSSRYLRRELNWTHWQNIVGIRYDEPRRAERMLREGCEYEIPLFHARVTAKTVNEYWSSSDFDLKIPSLFSNCDCCFLKGKFKLLQIMSDNPLAADWWIEQEAKMVNRDQSKINNQFRQDISMKDLKSLALSQSDIFIDNDDSIGCFCGD